MLLPLHCSHLQHCTLRLGEAFLVASRLSRMHAFVYAVLQRTIPLEADRENSRSRNTAVHSKLARCFLR